MDVYVVKNKYHVLTAYSEEDQEKLRKVPRGQAFKVVLRRARDAVFHRKYFSMLRYVLDNNSKYETTKDLLIEIKLKLGYYEEYIRSCDNVSIGKRSLRKLYKLIDEDQVKAKEYLAYLANKSKGELVYVPKSIDFDHMDQDEFQDFYAKSIDAVLGHFIGEGTDEERDQIAMNVLAYLHSK